MESSSTATLKFLLGNHNKDHRRLRPNTLRSAVAATFTSLPFGAVAASTLPGGDPAIQDNASFATLDQDPESNTHHAQFRNYSPTQGRWLTPDPYYGSYDITNPQSFNRYAYAANNPLTFVDPSGLEFSVGPGGGGASCANNPVCVAMGGGTGGGGGTVWGDPFGGPPTSGLDGYDGFGDEFDLLNAVFSSILYQPLNGIEGNYLGDVPIGLTNFQAFFLAQGGPASGSGAASGDPCANPALNAAGVNIRQNIAAANAATLAGTLLGAILSDPFTGALTGYGSLVQTGGLQDFKSQPGPGTYQQRVDAGNVSYGVTCLFGAAFCQFAAGLAQTLSGNADPSGTLATGFDTPSDNASIRQGQAMRAAGCHG